MAKVSYLAKTLYYKKDVKIVAKVSYVAKKILYYKRTVKIVGKVCYMVGKRLLLKKDCQNCGKGFLLDILVLGVDDFGQVFTIHLLLKNKKINFC